MNPIKEKCVVYFKLCIDFNWCDYSKGNEYATSDMKTQQWNKSAHLTNHAKCKYLSNEKNGMPLHEMQVSSFKWECNHS